jgi:hypothetical protein
MGLRGPARDPEVPPSEFSVADQGVMAEATTKKSDGTLRERSPQ